jgi:phosphatidylinositol 3-kinase
MLCRNGGRWNEWLLLPIKLRDLPATAQLVLTLWELDAPGHVAPVGGSTFRLFTRPKYAASARAVGGGGGGPRRRGGRAGPPTLDLCPNCEGDGSALTTTPSKSAATEEAHRRDKVAPCDRTLTCARASISQAALMRDAGPVGQAA